MSEAGRMTARGWPFSKTASLRRFGSDDRGATAVEFALVAIPFFMFVCCLIGCSLYFFVVSSLEKGMDEASRLILTGQAANLNMTVGDFRNRICDGAGRGWISCDKVQVWTDPFHDWSDISNGGDPNVTADGVHNCVAQNNTVLNNSDNYGKPIATEAGEASDVVIVTVCYPWEFASKIPFLHFDTMQNGALMIQSSTAFRSEPYKGADSGS